MPDNRKPLIYGSFPVCRNYTVRAHIRNVGAAKWDGRENALRHAGACVGGHDAGHFTHSTSDMQHAAARKIDCGIGKAELPDEPAPQANAPAIVDFQPYMGKVRKPGTGCISQINDHLFEGRYSPTWIDGKKHARNVYAHTREECEEKLKVLIAEMKAELAELKRQYSRCR